jgi:hypothetical protein
MSNIPVIMDMTDPDGRELIPPRVHDHFRHKPVWAAYKFRKGLPCAEARSSEFLDLAAAKATVDALNICRGAGEEHYFKVYYVVPLQA